MRRTLISTVALCVAATLYYAAFGAIGTYAGVNNPSVAFPRIKSYSSNQSLTCPPTATWAQLELWGGSGGGGGGGTSNGGGGGGAGAYIKCLFMCSGGAITLTIGSAGVAGANSSSPTAGTNGTASSAVQGSNSCTASPGTGGVVTTGAGGIGGGATAAGVTSEASFTLGSNGGAGSGTNGGPGGNAGLAGGAGGNPGLSGSNGQPGLSIVTYF